MLRCTSHGLGWLLTLFLALMFVGCRGSGAPSPTPARLALPFDDGFDAPGSRWLQDADTEAAQGYRDGQFFFQVLTADLLVWDNPGGNFQDFSLEVEARQVAGDAENSYGVLVRYLDAANFYRFDLSGDGRFAVFKLENGEWITLVDWQAAAQIQPQGQVNRIQVTCQGAQMAFFANGEPLVRLEDATLERGDVGLFAGAFASPPTEVEFDNLILRAIE